LLLRLGSLRGLERSGRLASKRGRIRWSNLHVVGGVDGRIGRQRDGRIVSRVERRIDGGIDGRNGR
jgi:hypothetical protein